MASVSRPASFCRYFFENSTINPHVISSRFTTVVYPVAGCEFYFVVKPRGKSARPETTDKNTATAEFAKVEH